MHILYFAVVSKVPIQADVNVSVAPFSLIILLIQTAAH